MRREQICPVRLQNFVFILFSSFIVSLTERFKMTETGGRGVVLLQLVTVDLELKS